MLARKARTSAEVADELAARGAGAEQIASVLGRLKAHRHLDDAELAGDEAFRLVDGKGLAPSAAVQKLVERGIASKAAQAAVEAAVDGRSEAALCERALEKRLKGRLLMSEQVPREGRALARLGYDEGLVARALERALRHPGEE